MHKLTMTLQLVTPLLMFGVFNGAHRDIHVAQPEIRAASLRGGLRYWLRAVYGAAYGANVEGLHEAESRIFGSTSRGSAVTVRVAHKLAGIIPKQLVVLPEKVDSNNGKVPHKFAGFAITEGNEAQSFELILIAHPLRRDVFTPAFYSAVLLAFTLGGFGKRARRGGGALQIVGIEGDEVPEMLNPLNVRDGVELADALKTRVFPHIDSALAWIPSTPYTAHVVPAYPIFASDHCRVFVGKTGHSDYLSALKQIWGITGAYHRVQAVDGHGKLQFRENRNRQQEPVLDRWAWGYVRGSERRASALHMRVYRCTDGKYYPIVTIFRGGRRDENWRRVQEVVNLFETHADFTRAYGNTVAWT